MSNIGEQENEDTGKVLEEFVSTRPIGIDKPLAVQCVHHLGRNLRNNDQSASQKNRAIIVS